ncbi:hypothetical protein RLOC_00012562 [Lonchura striata]|uniref:Uncharacterized protein n=1 Tax=Lonchura striata TaxID=40157 RepID=A0A218V240_9PASE|nr:hypothetical protein RLOC_00012562 [Lonchura striata domestica]
MRMTCINATSFGLLWDDVFTTLSKTTVLMDIVKYLDQNLLYQEFFMGSLFLPDYPQLSK